MEENYSKDLLGVINELHKTLSVFTDKELNTVPFEGSWTAEQVADHLWKSAVGLPAIFAGGSTPTERPVHEKSPIFKSIFLDFTTKMKSPDFILPSAQPKGKQQLLDDIAKLEADISTAINSTDLTKTFTDFSFPNLGQLTGHEWLCFVYCHFTRHIRQIKKIYQAVINK